MGRQIFKQPNGYWAEYSTISDSFVIWDATKQELIDIAVKEASEDINRRYNKIFQKVENGVDATFGMGLSWHEAVENHNKNCEEKYENL